MDVQAGPEGPMRTYQARRNPSASEPHMTASEAAASRGSLRWLGFSTRMAQAMFRRWAPLALVLALLLTMGSAYSDPTAASPGGREGASDRADPRPVGAVAKPSTQNDPDPQLYLPLILKTYSLPMLMGVYTTGWPGDTSTYTNELTPLDTWTGKQHSLVGTSIDIEPSSGYQADVTDQLTQIWTHGYTPFVNLMTTTTAAAIASGSKDAALNSWAQYFVTYTQSGTRFAFIAPMPEMNGSWTPYNGCSPHSPADFKNAYARIQARFAANGVPAGSVRWVFAPNGYSDCGAITSYYPGDASVDVVSFSSYNQGYMNYCQKGTPGPSQNRWDAPSFTFGNYLPTLQAMAPTKPIFVSQTGTTADYDTSCRNDAAKNQWLTDAFNYLAGEVHVKGIIYYNTRGWENIDWPVYGSTSLASYTGYVTGAANPAYQYVAPADLKNASLLP